MSRFAIRTPYFIVVACLIIAILGVVSLSRMPVDMFPSINIPVVVVATFYSGMPPEQVENSITFRLERFLTLGSGIEHIESRSLTGVSIIKVYFHPGTDPDAAVAMIGGLATAEMSRLPPGTMPPVVLKFDASTLPVCLLTLGGDGLSETQLKDIAQNVIRNQLAGVPGASVPQPFGGRGRQMMLYADPFKLEAHQLSIMDVVRTIGESNVILPAGDVQIGRLNYNIYTNSMLGGVADINRVPLKMVGQSSVRVSDIGEAKDAQTLQYNVVRVNGQRSVYLPILKQGGDSNTIAVVDGIRNKVSRLADIPDALRTAVVFDQSEFVKRAIETLLHEGAIGLFLTSLMILVFLGSMRATVAVFFSIPLSALATFVALQIGGSSINTMVLGGLALALSRLIDNSVVVLENIYRHLEMGEPPAVAAEQGGREVALPVLAATLTTVVVFFPVTLLYGVSKYLFSSLALAVVLSLFASYAVAMTVVPLFCARYLKGAGTHAHGSGGTGIGGRFNNAFNRLFDRFLDRYQRVVTRSVAHPFATLAGFAALFVASLLIVPMLGLAFFPVTDAGQFVIRVKAPSGTRLEETENEIRMLEALVRKIIPQDDLGMVVSNIGVDPGFSSIFTSNSAMHTATVQVALTQGHRGGSYDYIARVKEAMRKELPQLTPYFGSGSLVESTLNMGLAAPIDVQIAGTNLQGNYGLALELMRGIRQIPGVADVFIPQDLDQPALKLDIDRVRARELGLSQREVVQNVITALTSNQMIAPSLWIDPRNGNPYYLAVQYPEKFVKDIGDLRAIPLRGATALQPTRLDMISSIQPGLGPTEVNHYQIRRTIDVLVRPLGEDLSVVAKEIEGLIAKLTIPKGVEITLRGMVQSMRESFRSFAVGLLLSVLLLYLILVAQFRSFIDPFIILLALPPAITGVLLTLWLTGTTLNVMSLMGIVMLAGVAMSNSILIVEFAHHLLKDGTALEVAVVRACRVRLRPVLMTSLATIIGLMPMAMKLGEGSEAYAPLARALIGGLAVSVIFTIFLVPAGFSVAYSNRRIIEEQL
ncbi:MAG: efflux RND transporter permease subunit [Bryobacterales bacterium]|nr:efflux RND transporter permease subunit [Bryobacterales bacterium]